MLDPLLLQVRPDRQTLLFSATFKKKTETLAGLALQDPVRIVTGLVGEVRRRGGRTPRKRWR